MFREPEIVQWRRAAGRTAEEAQDKQTNRMKKVPENTNELHDEIRDESNLIRQVKAGHQWAFTQLVSVYQKQVFRLAYGFFRDRDDAMEIVQETFLRVYQKLDGFDENDGRTQFKNWVFRIAQNLCIDFYRKFRKQKADMKDIYEFDENTRGEDTHPEDKLDRETFRRNLEESVIKLPRRQKEVFMLKHYNGLKHHEVGEILELSVGTVKSLYHRAIQHLKKHMVVEHGQRGMVT